MRMAFFGSSLLSSYWNGAATYYRGLVRALSRLGVRTTFYEPDAFGRQINRDIEPPDWADVVVYEPSEAAMRAAVRDAAGCDVIVKASGVGVLDDDILAAVLETVSRDKLRVFWDVDAPATLAAMAADRSHPLHAALPELDLVMTFGGGEPVVAAYRRNGARRCIPVYNALDPETHHPVLPDARFACDLAFLGNRLPDREARVGAFFFEVAHALPERRFLLGGAGWEPWQLPPNVRHIGHVPTSSHNAFNCTPLAVLNIARDSMASAGFSPATRVFEAAGAGACLVTDAWDGIEHFLALGDEVLVAHGAADVVRHLRELTPEKARAIGQRARHRVLASHTYDRRAADVISAFETVASSKRQRVGA